MTWHLIAHVSELANPGDFVCLPVEPGREIAATRMPDGELMVFDNRCPHRGARIYTEMFGNRPPRCGYHGRCARAADVPCYSWFEHRGWLIVSDGVFADSPPVQWHESLPSLPALERHSVLAYTYPCHWTVAVENALDTEHVAAVHARSLAPLQIDPIAAIYHGAGSTEEHFNTKPTRLLSVFPEADPEAPGYRHLFMFPYSALSSTAGAHYSLQHYFPKADGTTAFIHRLYLTPTPYAGAGDVVARFNKQVFEEDAAICATVAPWHSGHLNPSEWRIEEFRNEAVKHEVMRRP